MGDLRAAQVREDDGDVVVTLVFYSRDSGSRRHQTSAPRSVSGRTHPLAESEPVQPPPGDSTSARAKTPAAKTPSRRPVSKPLDRSSAAAAPAAAAAKSPLQITKRRCDPKTTALQSTALLAELGDKGQGREEVVLGLLDQGADPNFVSKEQARPLFTAALNGRRKCLPLLLDAGANVNACVPKVKRKTKKQVMM